MDPNSQTPQTPTPYKIPNSPYVIAPNDSSGKTPIKKYLIYAAIGLAVLVLLIILLSVLNSPKKTNDATPAQEITTESQAPSLEPADAITLNQATSFMSQELSTINDAEDFAEEPLSDKTLGL